VTAGRKKTAKPAKKATTKRATGKKPAQKAPPQVKVPKRTQPTAPIDPHSQVHPGDPDEALVSAAERGREAVDLKELTDWLSDATVQAYGRLNPREKAFIKAFLELRQATPAAIRAGYSKQYAHSFAGRLLNKPAIRAVINEIDRVNLDALRITDGEIVRRLWEEANFAFEGPTRVKALVALAELRDMFPAKKVKHGLIDPAHHRRRRHWPATTGARQPWTPAELMARRSAPRTWLASRSW
jgi:phage terminase small subunit